MEPDTTLDELKRHHCLSAEITFFSLIGEDAVNFLNALVSNDIGDLENDRYRLTALLDAKAKLISLFYVVKLEDGLLVVLKICDLLPVLRYLHSLHFAEKVSIPKTESYFGKNADTKQLSLTSWVDVFLGDTAPQEDEIESANGLAAKTLLDAAEVEQNTIDSQETKRFKKNYTFTLQGEKPHFPMHFVLQNTAKRFELQSLKNNNRWINASKLWFDISHEASFPLAAFYAQNGYSIVEQPTYQKAVVRGRGCYPGQEVIERLASQGKKAAYRFVVLLFNEDVGINNFYPAEVNGEGVKRGNVDFDIYAETQKEKKQTIGSLPQKVICGKSTAAFVAPSVGRVGVVARLKKDYARHAMEFVAVFCKQSKEDEHTTENIEAVICDKSYPVQVCVFPLITQSRFFCQQFASSSFSVELERGMQSFHKADFKQARNIFQRFLLSELKKIEPAKVPPTKASPTKASPAKASPAKASSAKAPSEATRLNHQKLSEQMLKLEAPSKALLSCVEALAVCEEKLNEKETAIALNKLLAALANEDVMPHTNLSRLYMEKGLIELAEKEKAKATMLSFKQDAAKRLIDVNRAEYAAREKAAADARIEKFKSILSQYPDDEVALYALGKIYFERGQFQLAQPLLARLVGKHEKHSVGYMFYGKTLRELGNKNEAEKVFRRGVAIAKENGDWMPLKAMEVDLANLDENFEETTS